MIINVLMQKHLIPQIINAIAYRSLKKFTGIVLLINKFSDNLETRK